MATLPVKNWRISPGDKPPPGIPEYLGGVYEIPLQGMRLADIFAVLLPSARELG
jgi:hypothetical protein